MGDVASMQEGRRSKSQVSVFDYPEHLNPFYEDENHKRLRFWKIGKKDGKPSRRGSFSLGGLREMWAFKSLRGKKKSSTLGINKTSESPEPLRRGGGGAGDNIYATYDPRYRNTYDNAANNNNFQRNVPYRTSLQNMNYAKDINANGNGIGFMRNDNYRSTIQITGRNNNNVNQSPYHNPPVVPARRYVYGGSITPQPRTRFDHNDSSQGFSRGSSQLSVASSTNPFEEDYDDDNQSVMTGRLSGEDSNDRPTPAKRRLRKKRRAPPPPVPIPKIITEENASNPASPTNTSTSPEQVASTTSTIETIVRYASTPTPPSTPIDPNDTSQHKNFENQLQQQMQVTREFSEQEKLEISNIAAEIEHYVQLLSRDEDDESSIRLIPLPKTTAAPVLKKAKSSTSLTKSPQPGGSIKKSGSESLMRALAKRNSGPTKDDLSKWRESSLKLKKAEGPGKIAEIRRSSLGRPTPTSRQRPSGSPPAVPNAEGRKFSLPETRIVSVEMKPIPSARQNSPTKIEEVKESSPKKDIVMNGSLSNGTAKQDDEENNFDSRSASSKENTPLNSSYDTPTEESPVHPIELKITESKEDVSEISNTSSSERYHIRYVPLKEGSPATPPQLRRDLKSEYKLINNNNNNPAGVIQTTYIESWVSDQEPRRPSIERRRSVKEIIESINRSQSLLKVNQNAQKTAAATVNNLNGSSSEAAQQMEVSPPRRRSSKENSDLQDAYRKVSQNDAEIKRMLVEMETLTNNREMDNYCDTVPSILDRFDEEVNNNDIFKKCVLKKQLIREGSPTASNLDWNPLPKPKRTKNLSVVLSSNEDKPNGKL